MYVWHMLQSNNNGAVNENWDLLLEDKARKI